ncbi:MAG TPA: Ig-like domain-containing protein, partial [Gemmatimonadaceae bacterium]
MLLLPSHAVRVVRSAILSVVRRRTLLAVLGFTLPAALGITVAARARGVTHRVLTTSDTFSPASGTHFTSASQSATVNACDDTYDITSMTATLNGSSVPVGDGLLASCPRGSPGSDKGVIDVTLAPGSNDVGVEICNSNGDCTSDDATYYYDVPAMTVTATTHAITYPLPSDTTSFVIYNTAGVSDNVDWSVSCTGGVTCSGSSTFFLAAGTNHTTQVTVSGSSAGTGKITFSAHYDTYPSVSGSDTTHATSTVPIPTVTAPSSPQSENPNTNVTLKFPVTVGAYGLGTYTYTPSCGTFTSCSVSPSSHPFSAAGTDTAYVSFHVPYLTASTNVSVGVTASGPATNSANTTVDVGAIPVSSVFVGFDAPRVNVSQGTTAHATIIYADGSTVPNATATWSSGNTGIATVNSSTGAVTGAGAGSTSITATVTGGSGSATIPVTTAPGTGLQVTMQRLNAEGSVSRDECLTIAAGDDAAYECGDLRLVHPLPGVTTMNEARAPMLIYNSRHSKPVALVAANVTGFGVSPSSLTATLNIGGHSLTHTYSWNSSCNSATCRIVIPVPADSLSLNTGWYADTLQVSVTSGGTPYTATDYGSVAVVNRTATPFGAGWWLDGLEQLVSVDATKQLWVAGDGNTRLYVATGVDSAYTPQTVVDRPDTLIHTASGTWQRHLRNGAYVEFNGSGQHIRTVNRERDTTRFVYSGTALDSIVLPTPSGTKPAYTFSYATNGASMLVLQSVTSPGASGARTTTVSRSGNWQLTQMEDPDGTSVYFTWDGNNRITRRKNRLNDSTTYSYDAAGGVKQVSIDMSRGGESAIVSTFCPAETRTLDSCSGDGTGTTPLLLSNVKTRYDGPRTDSTDVTNFFIGRFGQPDTVVDAHSSHTRVHRSLMFPALADSVIDPTGFKQNAVYTARGLLQASTAVAPFGGSNATTTYTYDDMWDQLTTVTAPTGEVSYFNYDPTTGNRLWQRTGSNDSTKVTFGYN